MTAGGGVARVLLDSALPQLDHLFDYRVPEALLGEIRPGQRVRVPFRSQQRNAFGYVIDLVAASDFGGELHEITDLVSTVPMLTPEVAALARAVADRAGGSANDILRLAIPARQVRVEKKYLAARAAAEAGSDDPAPGPAEEAAEATAEPEPTWDAALDLNEPERELAELLVSGGRVAIRASHGPAQLPNGEWVGRWAADLARSAAAVLATGHSCIVALPDYRDLDQLADALDGLGVPEVFRVDSRQSNAERYERFLRSLEPAPHIIVGNRSAVYAPAYRLGAIMVWDDGDPLLAEPLSPYVHARDAALVRAQQEEAGLVFAGHTRSAETQRLLDIGYLREPAQTPARTRVVLSAQTQQRDQAPGRIPEMAIRMVREALATGPVLVQVAAPGYAPVAVCERCHERAVCGACAGPLAFRSQHGPGVCRWCGTAATRWRCGFCQHERVQLRGAGATRTVEQFERQFPGVRVMLSDGDTPITQVDARPALIVATRGAEPRAAGGYAGVLLLDGERMLAAETLRVGEDCLRWWENAAALARPQASCLLAGVAGPIGQAFATGRLEDWLREELALRRELRYPPAVRVAAVTGAEPVVRAAVAKLDGLGGVDVLGPSPVAAAPGEPAGVRAIVRFDYPQGAEVASRLRGALVADAAGSASRARRGGNRAGSLRLRFDDRGVFDA